MAEAQPAALSSPRPTHLPQVKPKDPNHWNPEVVRALSTRLPFGHVAVTTPCETCRSVFYPCLCSTKKAHRKDVLRAPRIVEVSETLRLHGAAGGTGNLNLVKSSCIVEGVDMTRLLVLGHEVIGRSPRQDYSCTIIARHDESYVVTLDEQEDWTQEIEVTADEIDKVCGRLEKTARYVCERTPSERLQVELLTMRGFDEVLGEKRRISVDYDAEPEGGDLVLVSLPPPLPWSLNPLQPQLPEAGEVFVVKDVKEGGHAHRQGVRRGHHLIKILCGSKQLGQTGQTLFRAQEPSRELLAAFNTEEQGTGRQEALSPTGRPPKLGPPGRLSVPFKLQFNILPAGWVVSAYLEADGQPGEPLSFARRALGKSHKDARILLVRKPVAVVSRGTHQRLRHQHLWERTLEERTCTSTMRKAPNATITKADIDRLVEWGVNSRLTPSQLEYTFKKLIASLASELRHFEKERDRFEELMLHKAKRWVDVEHDRNKEERRKRADQAEIEEEFRVLFEHFPMYYLSELKASCASPKLSLAKTADLFSGKGEQTMRPASSTIREDILRRLPASEWDYAAAAALGLAGTIGGVNDDQIHDYQNEVTKVIERQADRFFEKLKDGAVSATIAKLPKQSVPGRIEVTWNRKGTHYSKTDPGRNDGRMSFDEFVRTLIGTGVSWLTKEDMARNFKAIDIDNSGFLSLGEVLRVSERMLELIRELREYESSNQGALGDSRRRPVPLLDLITSFAKAKGFSTDSPHASPRQRIAAK